MMSANGESGDDDAFPERPKLSPNELRARWQKLLNELSFGERDLVHFLWHQGGDPRPPTEVQDSIRLVMNGDTEIPAELFVVVHMLVRQQRRLLARHANLEWHEREGGMLTAKVDDWTVNLIPKSRMSWLVSCVGPNRERPDWRLSAPNLEAAKKRALASVEEGQNDLAWSLVEKKCS